MFDYDRLIRHIADNIKTVKGDMETDLKHLSLLSRWYSPEMQYATVEYCRKEITCLERLSAKLMIRKTREQGRTLTCSICGQPCGPKDSSVCDDCLTV